MRLVNLSEKTDISLNALANNIMYREGLPYNEPDNICICRNI